MQYEEVPEPPADGSPANRTRGWQGYRAAAASLTAASLTAASLTAAESPTPHDHPPRDESSTRFRVRTRDEMAESWDSQMQALGAFIRDKRKMANLSLRQLAERTKLSNPYLSQIERGLHQPSVRVIRLISDALNVSAETLLAQAGLLHKDSSSEATSQAAPPSIEAAIRAESRLSEDQKTALIAVVRSMLPAE